MKLFILFVLLLFSASNTYAQTPKSKLKALVNTKQFYDPTLGNYVEVQIQFVSYTLNYLAVDFGKQAEIEISLIFEQGDKIIKFDKYSMKSPVMSDFVEDFYDIKRFTLLPGEYSLNIEMKDKNDTLNLPALTGKINLNIKDKSLNTAMSEVKEVQVASQAEVENNFTKSGLFLLPKIAPKYESADNKIIVYFETYGAKTNDSILFLKQKLVNANNGEELMDYAKIAKIKNDAVSPQLKKVMISKLVTGAYYLYYELYNQNDSLLSYTGVSIERLNSDFVDESPLDYENVSLDPSFSASISKDSADYFLAALMPIVKSAEQKNILKILKIGNNDASQKYLQSFWKKSNPTGAYESWLKYKRAVYDVEASFGTNLLRGYETDRGRVFLQYGPASTTILRESTPSEYPYEIWQYDKIARFSNKRFIFYNPDLINNNYTLLHSDLIGEVNNYRWEYVLNKRNTPNSDIDDPRGGGQDAFGGNSNNLYKQY